MPLRSDISDIQAQPLLPQVRMIWFFIVTFLVALGLVLIQIAGRGQALAEAVAFTLLAVVLFGLFSMVTFVFAYLLGVMERATVSRDDVPDSPFADGRMPDQVIPPRRDEAV